MTDEQAKLREILDEYKDIALSDGDIMELMDGNAVIVRYSDIRKYSTIEELLGKDDVVFILYESRPHFGHWTVLIRDQNRQIEYFDSYGKPLDYYIDKIPEPFKSESGQNEKWLSKLLLEYDGPISYNQYKFQKLDQNVKDCGRWSVLRAKLKDLPLESFKTLFKGIYSDDLATFLTTDFAEILEKQI